MSVKGASMPGNNLNILVNCSSCGHVSKYRCAALVVVAFENKDDYSKVLITGEHFEKFSRSEWQEVIERVKQHAREDACL